MFTKVVAKKIRGLSNTSMGYVKAILAYDDLIKKYVPATDDLFPETGDVFIYSGYQYLNEGDRDELFELYDVTKSHDESKSCLYTASANNSALAKQTMFVPIIKARFDPVNRRINSDNYNINFNAFFFIKSDETIYGPLRLDYENSEWLPINMEDERFVDIEENAYVHIQENDHCVFEFRSESLADFIVGDYVIDLEEVLRNARYSPIYTGSKEDVITWGKQKLQGVMQITREENEFLKKISKISFPNNNSSSEQQKFKAFSSYVGELNDWVNIALPNLLTDYLRTLQGEQRLNLYLKENQNSFFSDYRKDEIEAINRDFQAKKDQLYALQLEIDNLQKVVTSEGEKIFEGVEEDDKNTLRQIIKNEAERKKFISYYSSEKSLEKISSQVSRLEGQRTVLENDVQRHKESVADFKNKETAIKDAIKSMKDEFFHEEKFAKKLLDSKIYSDILNNIDPGITAIDTQSNNLIVENPPALFDGTIDSSAFITEITSRLAKYNRPLEHNDVVNYLVTLHQNFLTVLAGPPGIGKTSLVTLLARALGSYDYKRFLPISVQKGWTSSKDLIGYYNPITRKYQPAKTKLYHLLKQLEKDQRNQTVFPSIVLLDEANLSPMEHYWSEFSAIVDDDYEKTVSVSEQESIQISSSMKFVATINYDHTTEILSERLISRTPIIKLTKSDSIISDDNSAKELMSLFEWCKIDQWLTPNRDYYKGDIKNRFESIIKKLEDEEDSTLGQPIIVSPRKQKAVEKYCAAAGPLMKNTSPFTTLDYAVNQYILPLISGRGDAYKKRLQALQEKLQQLPMSSKHLEKIILAGDNNFKYYKFFY